MPLLLGENYLLVLECFRTDCTSVSHWSNTQVSVSTFFVHADLFEWGLARKGNSCVCNYAVVEAFILQLFWYTIFRMIYRLNS